MIKFLIEYFKLLRTIVLGILLLSSMLFSILGPAFLVDHYHSYWWLLLYMITLPYLALTLKKLFENK